MNDEKESVQKFISCPGDRYRPVYTPEVMDDGQIDLVQTGVEDLQQYIDSFKDSCDISLMVQRYIAGDETALRNGNPVFMDLLGAPKTLLKPISLILEQRQLSIICLLMFVRSLGIISINSWQVPVVRNGLTLKIDPVLGPIEKEVSGDA